MILELDQNEIMNIPKGGCFWLPIKRLKNTHQVIWVEDGADLGTLDYELHTYKDENGDVQPVDMSAQVKVAKNNYIKSMTITTNSGKQFDAHLEARINMLTAIEASKLNNLTSTKWKLATGESVEVTLDELKEASLLALTRFAELKGIS
ncbi:MAG: hypothetical protein GQ570_15180 [Helicobacteraceae bacterium]|nr:hypothetical protein [Helicobacteraceae bacterium]